jgi:K+-transporting ATPase KdpF subunit
MSMAASDCTEVLFMDIESIIMLVICVFMMVYLMYALLKPENF